MSSCMQLVWKYLCSLERKYAFFKHVEIKSVKLRSQAYRNSLFSLQSYVPLKFLNYGIIKKQQLPLIFRIASDHHKSCIQNRPVFIIIVQLKNKERKNKIVRNAFVGKHTMLLHYLHLLHHHHHHNFYRI